MDKENIGSKIREARIKAGLTQRELGIACGCNEKYSQQLVWLWENERQPIPRKKMIVIAQLLDIPCPAKLNDRQDIAKMIKSARLKAGLTQMEVGMACGYTEASAQKRVSKWEHGEGPVPKHKRVTVSKLLNIPIEKLL